LSAARQLADQKRADRFVKLINILLMIFFKYHNKVKKVNIDRHSSIDDVIAVVTNLFHLKARLIGMLDQDGSRY
jgi:hypothetical protein